MQILNGTLQAGADKPAHLPPTPETPLVLLDTPANRKFANRLREAMEAAQEVDRERYGEGTDGIAGILQMLLLETEIYGPVGSRGE